MSQHINRTGRTLDLPTLPDKYQWEVHYYPQVPYGRGPFWQLSLVDPTGRIVEFRQLGVDTTIPEPHLFTQMGEAILEHFASSPHNYTGIYKPVA